MLSIYTHINWHDSWKKKPIPNIYVLNNKYYYYIFWNVSKLYSHIVSVSYYIIFAYYITVVTITICIEFIIISINKEIPSYFLCIYINIWIRYMILRESRSSSCACNTYYCITRIYYHLVFCITLVVFQNNGIRDMGFDYSFFFSFHRSLLNVF